MTDLLLTIMVFLLIGIIQNLSTIVKILRTLEPPKEKEQP